MGEYAPFTHKIRYLSLFSGIGGFEQAIHYIYPNAECIGYSEVDPYAIKIYSYHFPDHNNLGDITNITKEDIQALGKIDLIVGGFPCTNLSCLANVRGNSEGLDGPKSGLFHDMIRIMSWVKEFNPEFRFVIENNFSMKKIWKKIITDQLQEDYGDVYCHMINNAKFGVQTRKRIVWTNFPYEPPGDDLCSQTWEDVLEPEDVTRDYVVTNEYMELMNKLYPTKKGKGTTRILSCKNGRHRYTFKEVENCASRLDRFGGKSDTIGQKKADEEKYTYPVGKSRPIITSGGGNNLVFDRRPDHNGDTFIIRKITMIERERLFGLPDNYTNVGKTSDTRRGRALGNSVPVFIIKHVLSQMN